MAMITDRLLLELNVHEGNKMRWYYKGEWEWEWDDQGLTLYRGNAKEVMFYPKTAIISATTFLKEEEK